MGFTLESTCQSPFPPTGCRLSTPHWPQWRGKLGSEPAEGLKYSVLTNCISVDNCIIGAVGNEDNNVTSFFRPFLFVFTIIVHSRIGIIHPSSITASKSFDMVPAFDS